jgi:integrase
VRPEYITLMFGRLIKRLGLPEVSFHTLRHTHATQLLKEGIHPKIVSERLGHATVGLTLDVYSHVLPDMQTEAARRIDSALLSALSRGEPWASEGNA